MMKRHFVLTALLFVISISGCTSEVDATRLPLAASPDLTSTAVYLPVVTRQATPPSIPTEIAQIELPFQPGDILSNPQTEDMYVLGGTQVAVLSGTELTSLIPLPGTKADQIILDSLSNMIYVTHDCEGQGCITIIKDGIIEATLKTSLTQLMDMAIDPDSHLLYVIGVQNDGASDDAKLIKIDGTEILQVTDLGAMVPNKIAIDPVYDQIYVGGLKLDVESEFVTVGSLVVIDEQEAFAELELGQAIVDIAINPHTGDTYVLQIPDYDGDKRLEDFTLVRDGKTITDTQVEDTNTADYLGIHPLTNDIYVVSLASQTITVLRNVNDRLDVLGEALTGSGAAKMTADPHTGNVYFANFNDNTVSVLNGLQNIATLNVGWYPYGLGVNPQSGWVYVSNTNERTVTILGYDE